MVYYNALENKHRQNCGKETDLRSSSDGLSLTGFEELVNKIAPKLHGITHKLHRSSGVFSDEDLYEEALLHLWQDFRKGALDDKTDSYILQGCYFYLKNYLRTLKARSDSLSLETFGHEDDLSLKESLLMEDEHSKHYIDELDRKMLAETIQNNGLTQKEKNVLSLYKEGLTIRDIGGRLGVSHVSIVKMMSKIRVKCIKYLDKG